MTVCLIEKRCTGCKKVYPATSEYFRKDYKGKNGLGARCKGCSRKASKERIRNGYKAPGRKATLHKYNNSKKGMATQRRYRRTQKGQALSRRAKLKYYYNLTIDDYNIMLKQQDGRCAICRVHQPKLKRRFDIDHNHETGKIRGLLCNHCNQYLGLYENTLRCCKPKNVKRFEKYLAEYK